MAISLHNKNENFIPNLFKSYFDLEELSKVTFQ